MLPNISFDMGCHLLRRASDQQSVRALTTQLALRYREYGGTVSVGSHAAKTTCPGQLRCLGQIFSQKSVFKNPLVRGGGLRCPGQNFFSESVFFGKATCPGQLRCLGQNFLAEIRLLAR